MAQNLINWTVYTLEFLITVLSKLRNYLVINYSDKKRQAKGKKMLLDLITKINKE